MVYGIAAVRGIRIDEDRLTVGADLRHEGVALGVQWSLLVASKPQAIVILCRAVGCV